MKLTSLFAAIQVGFASSQATRPVSSAPIGAPVVNLGYANYLGYKDNSSGITYYRGIQYAQPPVGDLRWQRPRPIEDSNSFNGTTLNATEKAPTCHQSYPYSLVVGMGVPAATGDGASEDCLVLDVLVPTNRRPGLRPVIVQIHGGGFTSGSAQTYPGDAMVHASDGEVMYVSIQYRLGLLGFLGGSQVSENGDLNVGLLDQRAALDWIQRHIKAFGGDPARVTLWGGSAGGAAVTFQLTAGGAIDNPPFSAAIAEYPWWQPMFDQSQQEMMFATTLSLTNCSSIACLRALPTDAFATLSERILAASDSMPGAGYGTFLWGPVIDGKFVQKRPSVAFEEGQFYDVPIMVDHEQNEGYVFSNTSQTTQAEQLADAKVLLPNAGPEFFTRLFELYPRSKFNSTFLQRQTWFGDIFIVCPTALIASAAVNNNRNSSAVYKMIFDASTGFHGSTAPYLANTSLDWKGVENQTLAAIMTSYWISFAVTHDPNELRLSNAPVWPAYVGGGNMTARAGDGVGFSTLVITDTTITSVRDRDVGARCDFIGDNDYVTMH